MLSLSLARQLKEAGLAWIPAEHDFFAIPDRGLEEKVFVISDMTVYLELLQGRRVATFHGTPEWALDYMLTGDLVWLPTEGQLREELMRRLPAEGGPILKLVGALGGYRCEVSFRDQSLSFEANGANEAYAAGLLHVLRTPLK